MIYTIYIYSDHYPVYLGSQFKVCMALLMAIQKTVLEVWQQLCLGSCGWGVGVYECIWVIWFWLVYIHYKQINHMTSIYQSVSVVHAVFDLIEKALNM